MPEPACKFLAVRGPPITKIYQKRRLNDQETASGLPQDLAGKLVMDGLQV